jgi:hypothetical protein
MKTMDILMEKYLGKCGSESWSSGQWRMDAIIMKV